MSLSIIPPLLIGLYPLIHFAAENIEQVALSALLVPYIISFTLLLLVIFIVLRKSQNRDRRMLLLSGALLLFFTYGALSAQFEKMGMSWRTAHSSTMVLDATLFILLLFQIHSIREIRKVRGIIILFGTLLWLTPVSKIIYFSFTEKTRPIQVSSHLSAQTQEQVEKGAHRNELLPDVFFFVFDRYPNSKLLRETFSFDNSEFLAALMKRGFKVCQNSHSPYPTTTHSLAAILNMNYISELLTAVSASDTSQHPMYRLIAHNSAVRPFLQSGYTYTHLGSWWGPTSFSPLAHENVNVLLLTEVSDALLRYTPLYPLFGDMIWVEEQHRRIHLQMNTLKSIVQREDPQFVLGHFTIPHEPAVFSADGGRKYRFHRAALSFEENFIEQLRFVNSQVLEFLDELERRSSSRPYLVLLQSDEGPYPDRFRDKEQHEWSKATPEEIAHKLSALSAFLLPSQFSETTSSEICTPVNIFRVVHEKLFSRSARMLPRRNFMPRANTRPFDFFEVTDRLKDQ